MFDWHLAIGIAFGFGSGWMARAAIQVQKGEAGANIRRDFLVSIMISGGSLIAVLWATKTFSLEPLGATGMAFAVAFGGVKAVGLFAENVLEWLRLKLTPVDQIMGERRQNAAKDIAAAKLAQKEAREDPDA